MDVNELAPEVMKLPIKDRALLAAFLWESIDDPYSRSFDLDDTVALDLAERRDKEIEAGLVTPVSHSQLMERLRG
ncbi:MAG: addiction module protein [Verrucomicrobiales bacterium]|jgi:putative addiction module component (TIGR02574 family)|nr:addiction module protein [Verrucomicrobiales bacterium]